MTRFLTALYLFFLVACTSKDPLKKLNTAKINTAEEVMIAHPMDKALATVLPDSERPITHGRIVRIDAATACRIDGGVLPYVWSDWKEPRPGEALRLRWTTRACQPYENDPAILAVSFRPATAADLTPFGHVGCWLTVNLDFLIAPTQEGILTREANTGIIDLNWMIPNEFAGMTWYAQLLVATNETRSGWVLSPGIEVIISSN